MDAYRDRTTLNIILRSIQMPRRKKQLYIVTRRLVGPDWECVPPQTYHHEANDCRMVFTLMREAETVQQLNLGFRLAYSEIKRQDGTLVDFTRTVQSHVGLEHFWRCPDTIKT